jgi:hypothetical protein
MLHYDVKKLKNYFVHSYCQYFLNVDMMITVFSLYNKHF